MSHICQETTDLLVDNNTDVTGNVMVRDRLIVEGMITINDTSFGGEEELEIVNGLLGGYNGSENNVNFGTVIPYLRYYDGLTGLRNGNEFPKAVGEPSNSRINYCSAKESGYLGRMYTASSSMITRDFQKIRLSDQLVEYFEITGLPGSSGNQYRGLVYDKTNDRYVVYYSGNGHLYVIHPETFVAVDLTSMFMGPASPLDQHFGISLVNNTIFVLLENTAVNSASPNIFHRFNKTNGHYLGTTIWNGSLIMPSEFVLINDTDNDVYILTITQDTANARLWFLIGNSDGLRYIGHYQAASITNLEADLASGNFDITIQPKLLKDYLNALVYLENVV